MDRREKMCNILGELAGAASMCWIPRPSGEFDSSQAIKFVDQAFTALEELMVDDTMDARDKAHRRIDKPTEVSVEEITEIIRQRMMFDVPIAPISTHEKIVVNQTIIKIEYISKQLATLIHDKIYGKGGVKMTKPVSFREIIQKIRFSLAVRSEGSNKTNYLYDDEKVIRDMCSLVEGLRKTFYEDDFSNGYDQALDDVIKMIKSKPQDKEEK